jgi:hypothetical protein
VADCRENGIRGITLATFEMASAKVSVCLQMANHGFDSRSAPELAFDSAEDTALLPRDKDAPRVGRVVAAIALVDIAAFDRAAGETFGGVDDVRERVSIVRVARQRFGVQHELSAGSAGIGSDDGDFDTELIGRAGLPLPMHSTSGAWKE